jgi:hypothetical protein
MVLRGLFITVIVELYNQVIASNDANLYEFGRDAKYDWEILHRGDIRYVDFFKEIVAL